MAQTEEAANLEKYTREMQEAAMKWEELMGSPNAFAIFPPFREPRDYTKAQAAYVAPIGFDPDVKNETAYVSQKFAIGEGFGTFTAVCEAFEHEPGKTVTIGFKILQDQKTPYALVGVGMCAPDAKLNAPGKEEPMPEKRFAMPIGGMKQSVGFWCNTAYWIEGECQGCITAERFDVPDIVSLHLTDDELVVKKNYDTVIHTHKGIPDGWRFAVSGFCSEHKILIVNPDDAKPFSEDRLRLKHKNELDEFHWAGVEGEAFVPETDDDVVVSTLPPCAEGGAYLAKYKVAEATVLQSRRELSSASAPEAPELAIGLVVQGDVESWAADSPDLRVHVYVPRAAGGFFRGWAPRLGWNPEEPGGAVNQGAWEERAREGSRSEPGASG